MALKYSLCEFYHGLKTVSWVFLCDARCNKNMIILTYCGLVMPYGIVDLDQHWFSSWIVAWWHQAITSTNVDWSPVRSRDGGHLVAIFSLICNQISLLLVTSDVSDTYVSSSFILYSMCFTNMRRIKDSPCKKKTTIIHLDLSTF